MAFMFSRVANNFAKNGYYPTDERTLAGVFAALDTNADSVCILDPCCGEGVALAELKNHLSQLGCSVDAYGVEYDSERAWHAKSILDTVAHASIHDMAIKARQFGCLFLNPPYGDLVADKACLSDKEVGSGRLRLEKEFYKRANPWLAIDGILVLIVPYTVFDSEFAQMISRQYRDVRVFMAPEQQFKQCVLFGIKRKSDRIDLATAKMLTDMSTGQLPPTLDENYPHAPYCVPPTLEKPHFVATRLTVEEAQFELRKVQHACLWPTWQTFSGSTVLKPRRPLRALSDWHLSLALAAGQVSGQVRSPDGRVLLVRGDTYKDKTVVTTYEEHGKDGSMREIRTCTDKFVPVIKAIEFTPGAMYGHLVTIQ